MNTEITNNGTFWLPALHRPASVSCRYQVAFERDHFVYRLLSIQEQAPAPVSA